MIVLVTLVHLMLPALVFARGTPVLIDDTQSLGSLLTPTDLGEKMRVDIDLQRLDPSRTAVDQVRPSSLETEVWMRFGGGPASRM